MDNNPFFQPFSTQFGIPPFDLIQIEHMRAALDKGMDDQLSEVEAITGNPEAPTFGNTIEALERSGKLLQRVTSVFSNLVSSLGSEPLERLELEYAPKLAQHGTRIALDPGLFARIDALHAKRHTLGLAKDALRLLERRHLNFIRSGASLGPPEKLRMADISERLATLQARFSQNVVHDEKQWHLGLQEADLDGLPGFVRDGARQAAVERGVPGYVITLARSSIEPFMTFSSRRDLRHTAWRAWVSRGEHDGDHDNRPLIPEILALRADSARLLGYATYADFRLADTMAGSQANVRRLTDEVWAAGRQRAAAEAERLRDIARADGINDQIEPWDWAFYAEKVRKSEYAIDEAELKPYFVLENIQQAAFDTAGRLFGLRFTSRPDFPTYHPDVRAWQVEDQDGHVGVFMADNFARPGKRSGAWMSNFQRQHALDQPVLPIVMNNNNFTRGTPTLLSFSDAETLFHEFGHALHGLLSRVRYPSQSGTAVRRDFVEFPSQIFEHWLAVPETLRKYARHYATGEPLPDAVMRRLLAARTFDMGFATVEYTASAILDMALHAHPEPATLDVAAYEQAVLDRIGMPREIGPRHRPPHFQHLFAGSGYAAGYYAYLWAEVLDADGFAGFEAAGNPFDPEIGARLRHVLQSGDTADPMELYIGFRGSEPSTEALLRQRGLLEAALEA